MPSGPSGSSAPFEQARESIAAARVRNDLVVTEIPSPTQVAPFSLALAGDVRQRIHGEDSELGTGRFILLHDPAGQEAWDGDFRVVCFAQAPLETDIGTDPFLAEVTWSWLTDALEVRGAAYTAASGTATTIVSSGFGELAGQGTGAKVELRASWTPTDLDLGKHVEGWTELLCMLAGLPPAAEGVSVLSARRAGRD
ncbi:MAG: DUF3000 domain-containing protein [Acidobacteria bacterium]|nr:DUF3000 domain-containing protein [Acidobacteriota bacterium]